MPAPHPHIWSLHRAARVAASGSRVLVGYTGRDVTLHVVVEQPPTGTPGATLRYTLEPVDPGDLRTVVGPDAQTAALAAPGASSATLRATATAAYRVSWEISLAGGVFPRVYATLTQKFDSGSAQDEAGRLLVAGDPGAEPVPVTGGGGGGGDGAIVDGAVPAIRATVFDLANANPLAVLLTDGNGDPVAVGGGTQYTEDAAEPPDPVGTQLVARRRDVLVIETDADGDATAANSTARGELYVKHVDALDVQGLVDVQGTVNAALEVAGAPVAALNPVPVEIVAGGVPSSVDVTDRAARLLGHVEIDTWIGSAAPTVGQKTAAASLPVVLAIDQPAVAVADGGGSITVDNATLAVTGGGTEAAALRVTLANDSTGLLSVDDNGGSLTVDGTVAVTDGGGSITVDGTVAVADGGGSLTVDNATLSVVGGGAEATALRVTIANDSTGLLSVDDNGGSLTVDTPQLPGALVGGRLDVDVGASALPAGAATEATLATRVADATITARLNTLGAKTSANSAPVVLATDQASLGVTDAGGSLTVDGSVTVADGGGSLTVDGTVAVTDGGGSITVDNPALSVVGGGAEAAALRVTLADDSTGLLSVDDGGGSLTVDGTVTVSDGGGSITVDGAVTVADGGGSLTVDNAALSVVGGGVEATALRVTIATDSTGVLSVDDSGGSLTVDGTVTANAGTGTFGVAGPEAHDAPAASNPVLVAGSASAAAPADVSADGDVARVWVLRNGSPVANVAAGGTLITGDGANGLDVDVTRVQGTVTVGDGGASLSVDDSGGSLTVDNATLAVVGGGAEATALRVTLANDSTGLVSVDDNAGSLTVDTPQLPTTLGQKTSANSVSFVLASDAAGAATAGDVAHDAADSGNPVKVGAQARSALPTAVASADRVNLIADLFGRLMVTAIDPAQQLTASAFYTTQQTGTALATPAAGKKIAVTSVVVGAGATTGFRLILWFGAGGGSPDTTYTEGTDQPLLKASFAPTANSKPGVVFTPSVPVYAITADHVLRATTDAGGTVDIVVHYHVV
jgi:hypothetical protein